MGPRHPADILLQASIVSPHRRHFVNPRDEGHHNDGGRVEDRTSDLPCCPDDLLRRGEPRPDMMAQVIEDALHHDQRRIHDDAEVNRPKRNQVCRLTEQHHHGEGEEERQRDGQRDDHCSPKVP